MANSKGRTGEWKQRAKRNGVVAAIVMFVCLAVYLNWNYQQAGDAADVGRNLGDAALVGGETSDPLVGNSAGGEDGQNPDTSSTAAYFANARLNRQQARDSALSMLQESLSGENADQTMKEQTGLAIQTMADYTVTEAQIENLVIAKGYTDCVAFIGEESVSVVVQLSQGELTQADTARIADIVTQVTSFGASQVKIIEVPDAGK